MNRKHKNVTRIFLTEHTNTDYRHKNHYSAPNKKRRIFRMLVQNLDKKVHFEPLKMLGWGVYPANWRINWFLLRFQWDMSENKESVWYWNPESWRAPHGQVEHFSNNKHLSCFWCVPWCLTCSFGCQMWRSSYSSHSWLPYKGTVCDRDCFLLSDRQPTDCWAVTVKMRCHFSAAETCQIYANGSFSL